jgi:2-oxoisovalerate dehydrogenase E2 component (dihydrolipoyl transacylase)
MGRFVFKLPDVGEGTAEAELVGWHVKVGDTSPRTRSSPTS